MDGGEHAARPAGGVVRIEPAPTGFREIAPALVRPAPDHLIDDGACAWVVQMQDDLTGPERVRTVRTVTEGVTSDGLRTVAAVEAPWDPAAERLVVHHVRVLRDGTARELAAPDAFQILQCEPDRERSIYDGRLTAHLTIPDLRVGDLVETCYSVIGSAGPFAAVARLQGISCVGETSYALRAPALRSIAVRTSGPPAQYDERAIDGVVERRWFRRDLDDGARAVFEPDQPAWWIPTSLVEVADSASWAEVADRFRDGYASPERLPDELEARAAEIAARAPTAGERVPLALRLVQGELRYHAVTLGSGGVQPRPVEVIWASRFGDCKDASRLLVALLRRLGVEADPALVHTERGWSVPDLPPSGAAFDHCLVRVRWEGRSYWLDPVGAPQAGRLDRLTQARFGWALPLTADASLEDMGEDAVETVCDLREDWVFGPRPSSPARLVARTTFRRERADHLRRRIANDGVSDVAQGQLGYYAERVGDVRELEPLRVIDREDDNELETVLTLEVLTPWKRLDDSGHVYFAASDDVLDANLTTPPTPRRNAPIDLGPPRRVRTERLLTPPRVASVQPWREVFEGPGVKGRSLCEERVEGGRLRQDVQLVFERRVLQPQEAAAYFRFCEAMYGAGGLLLRAPANNDQFGRGAVWWLKAGAVVGALLLFGLIRSVF